MVNYKAGNIDFAQMEKESFLQTVEVPATDSSHLITELSSNSHEDEEEYNAKSPETTETRTTSQALLLSTTTIKRTSNKRKPKNRSNFNVEIIIEGKRKRGPEKALDEAAFVSTANEQLRTIEHLLLSYQHANFGRQIVP